MIKYIFKVFAIVLLLIVSCVLTYPSLVYAIPPLSDSNAIKIIEQGTNKEYLLYAPIGEIGESRSAPPGGYPKSKLGNEGNYWFPKKNIDAFMVLREIGLLQITPFNKNYDSRKYYNISLTEKGMKVNVGTNESNTFIFRIGEAKVYKIIKNTEYKNANNPNEEFRLVLGIFDYLPTAHGKDWYTAKGIKLYKQYKFKALLKYDAFVEKYIYVKRDWGYIDKDEFETRNIK